MDNNTKKIAIGVGIIALLVWYTKKEKVTETSTGGSGGVSGGIGGVMPMGITLITTPNPTPTNTSSTTTTNTTPSSSTASTASTTNTTTSSTPVKVDTAAPNIPIDPSGGRGVYMPTPTPASIPSNAGNESVKCPNNIMYSVPSAEVNSSGGAISWCNRNGHYAGSTNFVGFDGKIKRPSYKVDFF